ncbi:MAG: plastocyanin/azurin family copper-binding protein [Chloroflexota bacterium]
MSLGWVGLGFVIAGVSFLVLGAAVGSNTPRSGPVGPGMMGGGGGGTIDPGLGAANGPQPGETGFVAGTVAAPRVIHVIAGPGYSFSPSSISVARGESVTFEVTTMGPLVHEFMVGPAGAVAADQEGTPEIADLGMMQTESLTSTFDGSGPYAYACHVTGHYEAGMRGTIKIVG